MEYENRIWWSYRALVSSMTAQRIPVFSMAARRLSRVSWWYSWDPWEKLKRATFMPARRSFSIIGTERDAGPSVHTIFVFGFCSATTLVAISSLLCVSQTMNKSENQTTQQQHTLFVFQPTNTIRYTERRRKVEKDKSLRCDSCVVMLCLCDAIH